MSWATMQPSTIGPHKASKKDRGNKLKHWKGCILGFLNTCQGIKARVQHVYMARDLCLEPSHRARFPPHCEFTFFFVVYVGF